MNVLIRRRANGLWVALIWDPIVGWDFYSNAWDREKLIEELDWDPLKWNGDPYVVPHAGAEDR